jgi:hypothetical protein
MLRTLIKIATGSAAALTLAATAQGAEIACEATPILLQDVTIVDASGRWSDQDIYIEDGRISALGSDLLLETGQLVTIVRRPGAIVRPRAEEDGREAAAIFIRTAARAPSRAGRAEILMPGAPADLVVYGTEAGPGAVEMEIRGGRIVGAAPVCNS